MINVSTLSGVKVPLSYGPVCAKKSPVQFEFYIIYIAINTHTHTHTKCDHSII